MHDWIFSLADDFLLCDSNLLKRMSCPSEFICFPLPVAMAMPKTKNNKFARFLLHNCATKHKSRPRTFRDLLNGVVWISSGRFGCALEFLGKEGDKSAMGRIERWDKKRNIFLYSILGSLCLDCRDLLQNYVVEMVENFEFLKQSCQEIWILWKSQFCRNQTSIPDDFISKQICGISLVYCLFTLYEAIFLRHERQPRFGRRFCCFLFYGRGIKVDTWTEPARPAARWLRLRLEMRKNPIMCP